MLGSPLNFFAMLYLVFPICGYMDLYLDPFHIENAYMQQIVVTCKQCYDYSIIMNKWIPVHVFSDLQALFIESRGKDCRWIYFLEQFVRNNPHPPFEPSTLGLYQASPKTVLVGGICLFKLCTYALGPALTFRKMY